MSGYYQKPLHAGHGSGVEAAGLTLSEMVESATYRAISLIERSWSRYKAHRRAMQALDALERLNDRQLADLGLTRGDLTREGLAAAAAARAATVGMIGPGA